MNEELIIEVAKVIEEWNPLGEKANVIDGLEGYRYEAIDIISSSTILSRMQNVKESIEKVLTQAFNIELDKTKLDDAAKKIDAILTQK